MGQTTWSCPDFSLSQTLECGQCFRYEKKSEHMYTVISGQRVITLSQSGDSIIFYTENNEDLDFWKTYFDGERDYGKIKATLTKNDTIIRDAIAFGSGIRILKQDFFEMLLSFIISQNNHIPRIRGIIARLSEAYGTPLGDTHFAFPTPAQLADVTELDYRNLGCGFRARYLVDAVRKVLTEDYTIETLQQLETDALREKLMEICGVGVKVADCILLFALARTEVFPTDVWIKRVYSQLYHNNEELSPKAFATSAKERFGENAGFAQQYLFHYGRIGNLGKE